MYYGVIADGNKRASVDIPVIPSVPARDYYISTAGSGDGLTSSTPGPYSLLTSNTIHPGDHIYFNKGDSFNVNNLQLAAGVYVLTYGTGGPAKWYGSTSLAAATWTNEGSGNWSTPLASAFALYDESDLAMHQGESAWISVTATPSAQVRTLGVAQDAFSTLVGADAIGKEFGFRPSKILRITAHNSGTRQVTFTNDAVGMAAGMCMKFFNQVQFLTAEGDWAFTGGKLYLHAATNPTGRAIRYSSTDFAVSLDGTAVTFIDIDMRHYIKYAVLCHSSANVSITSCWFQYQAGNGIRTTGPDNTAMNISSNVFYKCALRGIETGGIVNGTISNNTISEIGTDANIGRPYDDNKTCGTGIVPLQFYAGNPYVTTNTTFANNLIYNVGYQGIYFWGNNNTVEKNHIYNYCLKWNDGGGIHTFDGTRYLGTNQRTTGNIVRQNLIHDGVGAVEGITGPYATISVAGIYFDDGITDNTIDANNIYNPGVWGILLNLWTTNHTITNNKVTGANVAEIEFREDSTPNLSFWVTTMHNCVVTGNQFVTSKLTSRPISLYNVNNNASFNPFTTLNNNHYVNPYSTATAKKNQVSGTPSYSDQTFAQWKTYTGLDAAATSYTNYKVTPVAGDVSIQTNYTASSVNFNIPALNTDVFGAAPSNPYSIPAYGSLIYLKA